MRTGMARGLPGYAGITSPGNAPSAITVGALQTGTTVSRSDDRIPEYSSAGLTWYDAMVKPDFVAPGRNIVSIGASNGALYRNYPQLRAPDSDYMRLSGTSMATGVATGVVALMLEAYEDDADYDAPPLTPNAVKAAMQYTAFGVRNDLGLPYDILHQGAGGLNGKGAIQVARSINTKAAPGTPWLTSIPSPYSTIGGEAVAWNQTVIWGSTGGMTQGNAAWANMNPGVTAGMTFGVAIVLP